VQAEDSEEMEKITRPCLPSLCSCTRPTRLSELRTTYLTVDEWESMKSLGEQLDGRLIECYRDREGRWRFKAESDVRHASETTNDAEPCEHGREGFTKHR
jgi:hypothetical protein